MTHPRLTHVTATADDWGLSRPSNPGEDDRKRSLPAVATDLNSRIKLICNTADSVRQARIAMREHFALFARYGVPNPKAEQLVLALVTEAFRPRKH
jgi:hypothetical protein